MKRRDFGKALAGGVIGAGVADAVAPPSARAAAAPRKNTLASHNRLRNSSLSSNIPRSGLTILPTKSTTVVSSPRIQKRKVTKR